MAEKIGPDLTLFEVVEHQRLSREITIDSAYDPIRCGLPYYSGGDLNLVD